ncbi:hypothetical protein DL771_005720 [Monosporascus sp. 5C6A]|nr:hypothetical protein DL771_005720 [Monosporascus sp. 5C6A]
MLTVSASATSAALHDDRDGIHHIRHRDNHSRRGLPAVVGEGGHALHRLDSNGNANWAVTETIFRVPTDPAAALTCITNTGGRLKCGDSTAAQQS